MTKDREKTTEGLRNNDQRDSFGLADFAKKRARISRVF